ncbi:MAG: hypothetical protein JSV19_07835 [Phycisphaerales bacterium]|nr:MAG: hypothetical protein JSV19_07835 [Phycisphaerales bacterium]
MKLRFEYNGQVVSLMASLGSAHASYEREVSSPERIVEGADRCLYDARRSGRNRVEMAF